MEIFNINADDLINEVKYFEYYTLKQNKTLFELAKNKNVNPKLLAVLNGLEIDDFLLKNQLIMIPKNNYSYYITKEGDTLTTVAKTFNTSIDNVIKNNKTIYLNEGQLVVNEI
ncbi:MAG: LysM peptidoglycan-binding domain-containing protein [Bacilli bacterium]|nr:LysM peptidoglycan-binding domain-containing protein [Bacilli bacterium]MDD4406577.1 LysM peptidoglycan-binding domain-containing protein [Bacilli bacterium]